MAKGSKRPKGPHHALTPEWKSLVRRTLERLGISQADLADQIGCSSGAISQLLSSKGPASSRLVPKICDELKIPMPGTEDLREAAAVEMMRRLRRDDPAHFDDVEDMLRRYVEMLEEND